MDDPQPKKIYEPPAIIYRAPIEACATYCTNLWNDPNDPYCIVRSN